MMKVSAGGEPGVYRFGKGMESNSILRQGWGEPEPGFVWSEGRVSVVVVPSVLGNNKISATVWGYVPLGAPQEVLVFINGSFSSYFEVRDRTVIALSYSNVFGASEIELAFYLPTAVSPSVAERTNDKRRLAVALAVIQVAAEEEVLSG